MTERAYTVQEIDHLRRVISEKYVWGSYHGPPSDGSMSIPYYRRELEVSVENQLRTYMLAGLTADDLLASEKKP
jgi:hypothetical protein